jgi:hypothetical protein
VVLDVWVRATGKIDAPYISGTTLRSFVYAASNEGSPAAIKLHGSGAKDMFHVEVDGERCLAVQPISCHVTRVDSRLLPLPPFFNRRDSEQQII